MQNFSVFVGLHLVVDAVEQFESGFDVVEFDAGLRLEVEGLDAFFAHGGELAGAFEPGGGFLRLEVVGRSRVHFVQEKGFDTPAVLVDGFRNCLPFAVEVRNSDLGEKEEGWRTLDKLVKNLAL